MKYLLFVFIGLLFSITYSYASGDVPTPAHQHVACLTGCFIKMQDEQADCTFVCTAIGGFTNPWLKAACMFGCGTYVRCGYELCLADCAEEFLN